MPLKRKSFLVPFCPVCDKAVDLMHNGDSNFQVWGKKREVAEALEYTDGDTFEEKLAAACSHDCYMKYRPKRRKK